MADDDRNASTALWDFGRLRRWLQSLQRSAAARRGAQGVHHAAAASGGRRVARLPTSAGEWRRVLHRLERLAARAADPLWFTIGIPGRPLTTPCDAPVGFARQAADPEGPSPGHPLCCWVAPGGCDRFEPASWLTGRWRGVVASRLPRMPAESAVVLASLKRIVERTNDGAWLFAVRKTTLEPYLRHLALRHAVPHIVASACTGSLHHWIELCEAAANAGEWRGGRCGARGQRVRAIFWNGGLPDAHPAAPWRDVLAAHLPDLLHVLSVREGGHVHRTTGERLQADGGRRCSSRKVFVTPLAPPSVLRELCELGAVVDREAGAFARAFSERPPESPRAARSRQPLRPAVAWDAFRRWMRRATPAERTSAVRQWRRTVQSWLHRHGLATRGGWEFLTHWTRMPLLDDQLKNDTGLLDRMLESELNDAEEVETLVLQQILREGVLRGSAAGIRGGTRVVCWTAVPLWQWPLRRTYRPHRVRWDFDWYGVCVRRERLVAQGARPVQYGSESDWGTLPEALQPFFQIAGTGVACATGQTSDVDRAVSSRRQRDATDRSGTGIDWRTEMEWRLVGDFSIREALETADAFAFTRTQRQAEHLARRFRCAAFAFESLVVRDG